jgi:hypothetical protein
VRDDAFRAVWNMPGEGVLPFDENGLSAVNETWLRTMGYDHAAEILGKMPYEFAPERQPDGSSSIDTLRAAAANTAAEGRLDPAAARMALERLVRVVEDFDASSAAAALAEVVAMKWSGEESDLIMQLRNQVDTYEFDDAAATAARLIERLGRLPF